MAFTEAWKRKLGKDIFNRKGYKEIFTKIVEWGNSRYKMTKRKTWGERLHDSKDLPKVENPKRKNNFEMLDYEKKLVIF